MSDRGQLNSLQALRAYAACSVLVGHATAEVMELHNLASLNLFPLLAGVDIFFVISGFIMYLTSSSHFGQPGASIDFWIRRLIRIVPLYWLFTTLMVAALLVAGDYVNSTETDWGNIVSSYLFFPTERPGGRIAPVLSLGWTLNYEMFFYALFGLSMFLNRRAGIAVLLATLVALVVFGYMATPPQAAIRFWTNNVILEFAAGVLLGVSYRFLPRMESWLVPLALFAGAIVLLCILPIDDLPRFVFGGIPAAMIVAAGLIVGPRLDRSVWPWLVQLGNASFALYLCHRFVLRALTVVFDRLDLPLWLEVGGYVGSCLVVSCAVALATYHWVERPVLRWLNQGYRGLWGRTARV